VILLYNYFCLVFIYYILYFKYILMLYWILVLRFINWTFLNFLVNQILKNIILIVISLDKWGVSFVFLGLVLLIDLTYWRILIKWILNILILKIVFLITCVVVFYFQKLFNRVLKSEAAPLRNKIFSFGYWCILLFIFIALFLYF
jgi:hypothetical protein